jgi:hypothetical protein
MARNAKLIALTSGRKVVASAATAEALGTVGPTYDVIVITAETDNTGVIAVGGSDVVAALATRKGTPLIAGQAITLDIDDTQLGLEQIFIDATVTGDGVTYTTFR